MSVCSVYTSLCLLIVHCSDVHLRQKHKIDRFSFNTRTPYSICCVCVCVYWCMFGWLAMHRLNSLHLSYPIFCNQPELVVSCPIVYRENSCLHSLFGSIVKSHDLNNTAVSYCSTNDFQFGLTHIFKLDMVTAVEMAGFTSNNNNNRLLLLMVKLTQTIIQSVFAYWSDSTLFTSIQALNALLITDNEFVCVCVFSTNELTRSRIEFFWSCFCCWLNRWR